MPDAKIIYQRLLDEIGTAIETRDYAAYRMHFSLPHPMRTAETELVVETDEQLRAVFDKTCTKLALQNVRGLTRVCTVAQYVDETTIRGSHETWLVTPASQIRQTYNALSTLRREHGRWRVADSQYDGSGEILPNQIAESTPRRAIQEHSK